MEETNAGSDAGSVRLLRSLAAAGDDEADLGAMTRPLLDALGSISGLESTYLTQIHWEEGVQEILYARNEGTIEVPEGARVPWRDTLCRRAMESGIPATSEVSTLWSDSDAAREMGIRTYVSSPVVLPNGEIFGTLCGASGSERPVGEDTVRMLRVFSTLIADRVDRERRARENAQRAAAAEAELRERLTRTASLQHTLKTPVTVIGGWAEVLLTSSDRLDETSRREALEAIKRAADQLEDAIGQQLDEAATAGLDVAFAPVDVAALVRGLASDLRGLSVRHDLVVTGCADRVDAVTDARVLRIVVEHLVENAVKYSPDGGTVTIDVGVDAEQVRLEVTDTGVGLPPDLDVFAPFQRGVGEEGPRGAGLGLHVVRTLTQALGGEVTARPNPDGGTIFRVELPTSAR